MRVTIDAVPLLVRSAGVKTYLYYWIQHLRKASLGLDIRLFPFLQGEPYSLNHEGSIAGPLGTTARLGLLYLLNLFPNDISAWLDPRVDIFHTCKLLNPPRRAAGGVAADLSAVRRDTESRSWFIISEAGECGYTTGQCGGYLPLTRSRAAVSTARSRSGRTRSRTR